MIKTDFAELERLLMTPLPGVEVQKRMAPSVRSEHNRRLDPNGAIPSGVLILLYPENGEWSTVFIERTDLGPHGGQISLPGGKKEASDISLVETALRETQEEIGVDASTIRVLGELSTLFVPHSNFSITPVVGYVSYLPEFHENPDEVSSIICIPIQKLFDPQNKKEMVIRRTNLDIVAPYYDAYGHQVWGATAMIMSEFEALVTS